MTHPQKTAIRCMSFWGEAMEMTVVKRPGTHQYGSWSNPQNAYDASDSSYMGGAVVWSVLGSKPETATIFSGGDWSTVPDNAELLSLSVRVDSMISNDSRASNYLTGDIYVDLRLVRNYSDWNSFSDLGDGARRIDFGRIDRIRVKQAWEFPAAASKLNTMDVKTGRFGIRIYGVNNRSYSGLYASRGYVEVYMIEAIAEFRIPETGNRLRVAASVPQRLYFGANEVRTVYLGDTPII